MKIGKAAAVIALGVFLGMSFTGCSFSEFVDHVMGSVEDTTKEEKSVGTKMEDVRTVDDTLEEPVFASDLEGTTQTTTSSTYTLESEASVTDGGSVTYQWYQNNVNSNSGGTIIKGATQSTLDVTPTESGSVFYFCVATNTKEDCINTSTSNVREIVAWNAGTWEASEYGSYRYICYTDDGDVTYPVNTWMFIEGEKYYFDENGYVYTGWFTYEDGSMQYFDEQGKLLRDGTTPDGYKTDENGFLTNDE